MEPGIYKLSAINSRSDAHNINVARLQVVANPSGPVAWRRESAASATDWNSGFSHVIGYSRGLAGVVDCAARVAVTDATVLIQGETGTGKELFARAIHLNGPRGSHPFVVINCGAIPHHLLESELFGHVRGAFTGAVADNKGKIESAHRGTVFLDEIGEMPLDLQVRILRVIQEREVERVGRPVPVPVDVRIIAATHRNLEEMIRKSAFREDLYYRLAVVPMNLPALRQHPEDIPDLVLEFFRRSAQQYDRPNLRLPASLIPLFTQYRWPGNIRQLQNIVERVVVLSPGDEIGIPDLPEFLQSPEINPPPDVHVSFSERNALDDVEKRLVLEALEKCDWNQSKTARFLGITRKMLLGRISKHCIIKPA